MQTTAEQWTVYTNEQDSDQNYGPYVRWEFDSQQPDPRNGETAEREVYTVSLIDVESGDVQRMREVVERKLDADCCVEYYVNA